MVQTTWVRWVMGCVALSLWACAPTPALAEAGGGTIDAMSLTPLPEGPAETFDPARTIERDLTITLDPRLYADAEKAAEPKPAAAPAPEGGAKPAEAAPEPGKHTPPPLPLYNVEGQGGTLLVPMAYLMNRESPGTKVGMPTVGYTFVRASTKTVQEVHVSETFYRRIELGYTMGTLDLGDFPRDVKRTIGVDIGFQHVVLHNFNLRGLVLEEGKYNPAVTAGVTFKYNPNVQDIDRRLGGGVTKLGLARSNGTDFTLTATKTVIEPLGKRPLILTAGIRFSQAAQLGYLGFGDAYRMTGEGSVVYLITDWMALAYEYRQKENPYNTLTVGNRRLVGKEEDWQAVDLAFIISPHLTFAVGWLCAGNVANGRADDGWGFQLRYEF
jgi:hypothetical protein